MNEREAAAWNAGLTDLDLLKLYPADVPIEGTLVVLRQRFPEAFAPNVRDMSAEDYKAAQANFLRKAAEAEYRQRSVAATARALADSDARSAQQRGRRG